MHFLRTPLGVASAALCLLCAPLTQAANRTSATPIKTATPIEHATTSVTPDTTTGGSGSPNAPVQTVVVTAQRLNTARSGIETQTGASSYRITSTAIAAEPGGANVQLNQVLLQAPDVVQDSFGQIHIRGDHNDIQYRLNGIIIPEGINVFGQTLDPRLIASVNLLTGALPAEFGLNTAGIVDLTTNSGRLQPGGYVSLYGGSHQTIEPSFAYGGARGHLSYYVTGELLHNHLGIESADPGSTALHDRSTQGHAFGYFNDILGQNDRLSLIFGLSDDAFQIPNQRGLQPTLNLTVNGVRAYPSGALNERQHELTEYGIFSWQHAAGALNWQTSLSTRYTSLHFAPDWTGDLLYNGISQEAFKADTAIAWQSDASYRISAAHTLRAGFYLQHDSSRTDTTSRVLPMNPSGVQTSDVPLTVIENGSQVQQIESAYLQDEWKWLTNLTINYGVRFDHYSAYSSGSQWSPRFNLVWHVLPGTTVHAGYSRYFTPPPFELIGHETFTKFANTSALPAGSVTEDTAPVAERSDYYDVGVQQNLLQHRLTLAVDSYYETAQHLLDEGQFGAPIVLTPFNYRYGRIGGIELSGNFAEGGLSVYGNVAFQTARGKDVESSQFNFDTQALTYIARHYIALDHEERVSASAGVAYRWHRTRLSADALFGTGLRENLLLPSGAVIPNGAHTPSYTTVNLGVSHAFVLDGSGPLTVRFDVTNVFDKIYEIRSGTGIGVFLPQYGAPRGIFGGVSWDF